MPADVERGELIHEAQACLAQLRYVVGLIGDQSEHRPTRHAMIRAEFDRLARRIALLANTEQERRLRRSLPREVLDRCV